MELLQTDPKYAEEMKKPRRSSRDLDPKDLSENLNLVSADIRSKLDEIKRREVERLSRLAKRKLDLNSEGRCINFINIKKI